jgi:hypothetical protein
MPAGFRRTSEFQKLRHLYLCSQQNQDGNSDGSVPIIDQVDITSSNKVFTNTYSSMDSS